MHAVSLYTHLSQLCVEIMSIASNCSVSQFSSRLPFSALAYVGYGRHGSCHGRHLGWGAKIAW